MARQPQDHEAMQTVAVRMPVTLIAAIDLYRDKLKERNPAFRIERGEAIRDLLFKALALAEDNGPAVPGAAGGGLVEAPVTTGQDRGADRLPMDADQFEQKAAKTQDQERTTGRTSRKRQAAAQGNAHGAAGVR